MNRETRFINGDGPDPVVEFCKELSQPLEEVFNLVYLAAHSEQDRQRHLDQAWERLHVLRTVVLDNCNRESRH